MSEADTCRTYVLPKLYAAGWTDEQIREQVTVTDGRIVPAGNGHARKAGKRADHVLRYWADLALAVVEAKAEYQTPGAGLQQAMDYNTFTPPPRCFGSTAGEVCGLRAVATDQLERCAEDPAAIGPLFGDGNCLDFRRGGGEGERGGEEDAGTAVFGITKPRDKMKHSYPTSEGLKFLLQMIHNREMALPDFQRDFVWDPYATDELIESIISNYPAGSLLRIKNGHQLLFQPREIAGAPPLTQNAQPSYLVLDGQQRLTSLYQALYGVGDHRYYIDLAGLEAGKDLEDCAFYLRKKEGQTTYGTLAQQAATLVFPLGNIYGHGGFSTWVTAVLQERCKTVDEMLDLQKRLTQLYEQWIKPLEEYEFPMVTLHEETSGPAVCTIFETLNRTGIKLSVFELLTARFWAQDLNLRKNWEEVEAEFPIIKDYEIDPYYVLQIVGLLEPGIDKEGKARAPSIKRSDILNMNVKQANDGWYSAIEGLMSILGILRDDCGILVPGLIPYTTIVIPMAAVWASLGSIKGAVVGGNRIKLIRWFWCSVFGQQYENAPNSQAAKDFMELRRWMGGGEPPESVVRFDPHSINLRNVTPKQRAVYRGAMGLILHQGALDFHNRGKITAQLIADKKNPIDDHHIFPQAYLNERNISTSLRDCIVNRTYIDRTTNRHLSRRAPSDYFAEIRKEHGTKGADELFSSHLLPAGSNSPLLKDDFEAFLDNREKALMDLIKDNTSLS